MGRMFGTVNSNSRLFFVLPIQGFFLAFFSLNINGYWKIPLVGFTGHLSGDLCDVQHGIFFFLAMIMWSATSAFSFRDTYIRICFCGSEMLINVQSDKKLLLCLTMLVNSVLSFFFMMKSKRAQFKSISYRESPYFKAWFNPSVRPILSSQLAKIKLFSHCVACLTIPVPVCYLGGLYPTSMFSLLQNILYSFDMKALPSTGWFFSATPWRLIRLSRNSMTSLVSVNLHMRATGHLLYPSIRIKKYETPVLVYYVVYRKYQFVSLVGVWSIPVVSFSPSTIIAASNSYWNAMQVLHLL